VAASYTRDGRRIASAWAVGDLADPAGVVLAVVSICGAVVVLLSARVVAVTGLLKSFVEWAASIGTVLALAIAAWLVTLLRTAYGSSTKRRGIGVVWDVGTFWPRAAHPLAPPCYAERAVPEVVDRIGVLTRKPCADAGKVLTGNGSSVATPTGLDVPTGPVLLTRLQPGLDHRPGRGRPAADRRPRQGCPPDARLPGAAALHLGPRRRKAPSAASCTSASPRNWDRSSGGRSSAPGCAAPTPLAPTTNQTPRPAPSTAPPATRVSRVSQFPGTALVRGPRGHAGDE
jgi:hypothetical protein